MNKTKGRPNDDTMLCGLEHIERFFISKIAMINAIHAGSNSTLHRFGGAAMAGDFLAEIMCHFDADT